MRVVRRLLVSWRGRRAAEVERDVLAWHDACLIVLEGCSQGLRDAQLPQTEIGVTLDGVDRALFRVRDAGHGAQRALRKRNPGLSARLRSTTQSLVELRNETARFLIRAQGPTPAYLKAQEGPPGQSQAYQRAMHDVGQGALVRASAVQRDLDLVWRELQALFAQSSGPPKPG